MLDWLKEHKQYAIIAALIAAGGMYYLYFNEPVPVPSTIVENAENNRPLNQEHGTPEAIPAPDKIIVDVKGQVTKPGVYEGLQGERVVDIIDRAGGLTPLADASQVNFAEHVVDEMVIYIPGKGEEIQSPLVSGSGGTHSSASSVNGGGGKVDLNKADATELQTLPGIGPAKAAAIIEYRDKSGKFKTIEDIKNISGIGEKTFEKLRDQITVH